MTAGGAPVLAGIDARGPDLSAVFLAVRGQGQSRSLFWGSFDLAVTRFSGRPAPARENADAITREAYSHEVNQRRLLAGNGGFGDAAFYCYAAPAPKGLDAAPIQPAKAGYNHAFG